MRLWASIQWLSVIQPRGWRAAWAEAAGSICHHCAEHRELGDRASSLRFGESVKYGIGPAAQPSIRGCEAKGEVSRSGKGISGGRLGGKPGECQKCGFRRETGRVRVMAWSPLLL